MDTLIVVAFLAALVGLWWLSTRIEAHWVSKDGRRMLLVGQEVPRDAVTAAVSARAGFGGGRLKEYRATATPTGLTLSRRQGARRHSYGYRVVGAVQNPPDGKRLYLLAPHDGARDEPEVIVRMPATSRAVAVFDARLDQRHGAATSADQAPEEG